MERLPTIGALFARKVPVHSQLCKFCSDYTETTSHIFVDCALAISVSDLVAGWCRVHAIYAFHIKDLLSGIALLKAQRNGRRLYMQLF
ncbi:hypothetical protein R6Q57_029237 [Mikania cordata]